MAIETSSVHDLSSTQRTSCFHDSARTSPEPLDDFHALVRGINQVLGPCSGIDSADVDVEELKMLMVRYKSNEQDWQRYAFADHSRGYTRNLVDRGNGKANIVRLYQISHQPWPARPADSCQLILVWTPGKGSPVHDHANAHCVMKILKGRLNETLYDWPCQSQTDPVDCATSPLSIYPTTQHTCSARSDELKPAALRARRSTTYGREQVTYMSDRLGLHRVSNPSADEVAVSLHLYTPPNAARHGCHVFDESTGRKSHVQQCHFYSELGQKT